MTERNGQYCLWIGNSGKILNACLLSKMRVGTTTLMSKLFIQDFERIMPITFDAQKKSMRKKPVPISNQTRNKRRNIMRSLNHTKAKTLLNELSKVEQGDFEQALEMLTKVPHCFSSKFLRLIFLHFP